MVDLDFNRATTLVASPNLGTRDNVRMVLQALGFGTIKGVGTFTRLEEEIESPDLDLLVCEAEFPDGSPADLVHAMRHNNVGCNPFLPIITFTDLPSDLLVSQVIDAGSDDVLVMPFSVEQMNRRVTTLVLSRKPFVVTSDYVGPDRRRDEARPAKRADMDTLFDVPNPLRARALGEATTEDLQQAVDAMIAQVNLSKLRRHAVQVGLLVDRILRDIETCADPAGIAADLDRLLYIARDIARRLVGTAFDHVSTLCQSLISVSERLRRDLAMPRAKDLKLMRPMSQAVQAAFDVETEVALLATEISRAVTRDQR
ncbi:MAG: hypothetical protein KDE22_12080 [Rhodobacterales bacterium]|nr:hypothetical protein [Rhodobacterales bacterium]